MATSWCKWASPRFGADHAYWAQYSIYLPVHYIVALDRADNGIFNSSNTDVVEKVNFLVAVSQHGGTSVAEGSP